MEDKMSGDVARAIGQMSEETKRIGRLISRANDPAPPRCAKAIYDRLAKRGLLQKRGW